MKATRFHRFGGPDVLSYDEVEAPSSPASGEALIEIQAIGLNYIDTYHRSGLYPVDLPCIPGMEAAGTVAAVGEGVSLVRWAIESPMPVFWGRMRVELVWTPNAWYPFQMESTSKPAPRSCSRA